MQGITMIKQIMNNKNSEQPKRTRKNKTDNKKHYEDNHYNHSKNDSNVTRLCARVGSD